MKRTALLLAAAGTLAGLTLAPAPAAVAVTVGCAAPAKLTPALTKTLPGGVSLRTWTAVGNSHYLGRTPVKVAAVTAHLGPHLALRAAATGVTAPHTVHRFASEPGVIAAVNGDFFSFTDSFSNVVPYSAVVKDGAVWKATASTAKVVGVGTDGKMHAGQLYVTGKVTAGKASFPLSAINANKYPGLTVFTSHWGPAALNRNSVQVQVRAGKVVSTKTVRAGVPAGVTIFSAPRGSSAAAYLAKVKIGTRMSWTNAQTTGHEYSYQQAIGRGSAVLRNSKVVANCAGWDGRSSRPRTAIGWADGGSTVVFLTVNAGTKAGMDSAGLTYSQAAEALKAAGATHGVLVDGGGSTTLEARTRLTAAPARYDSSFSYERPVPNGFQLIAR